MQIFVLILFISLMASKTLSIHTSHKDLTVILGSLGMYLIPVSLNWFSCKRAVKQLNTPDDNTGKMIHRLEITLSAGKWCILGIYVMSLFHLGYYDWLSTNLNRTLNLGFFAEFIIIIPPILCVMATWWFYYPIDRRIRESSLIRQIDEGRPAYEIWSRNQYMANHIRHQLLLILIPLIALLTWSKIIELLPLTYEVSRIVELVGTLCIFILAPLIIQLTWDTVPLPEGELRTRLINLCKTYNVKIRELLLWRTFGGMINGAVMGVVGKFRFILLTDALLDNMNTDEVEAVMAHEIAHIKKRHIPWLLVCAIATFGMSLWLTSNVLDLLSMAMPRLFPNFENIPEQITSSWFILHEYIDIYTWISYLETTEVVFTFIGWYFAFGYFSRRFERQADTYAVQHFASHCPEEGTSAGYIGPEATGKMIRALRHVSALNHQEENKRSWRHGSIRWRIEYLRNLTGTSINECKIDREVFRLQILSAILLLSMFLESYTT